MYPARQTVVGTYTSVYRYLPIEVNIMYHFDLKTSHTLSWNGTSEMSSILGSKKKY